MSTRIHNPPHPGAMLRDVLDGLHLNPEDAAKQLGVSAAALADVLGGRTPLTAELALRIEIWLGGDHGGRAELWLSEQAAFDLWHAQQKGVAGVQRSATVAKAVNTPPETITTTSGKKIARPSPMENAVIRRGINLDPDAAELSAGEIKGMRPLYEFTAERRYTFLVLWSEEDREFVGLCPSFPSLSWLDKSPERAFSGIRSAVFSTVRDLLAGKEPLP